MTAPLDIIYKAAAAAKSLQLRPTLCDPIDRSPPERPCDKEVGTPGSAESGERRQPGDEVQCHEQGLNPLCLCNETPVKTLDVGTQYTHPCAGVGVIPGFQGQRAPSQTSPYVAFHLAGWSSFISFIISIKL